VFSHDDVEYMPPQAVQSPTPRTLGADTTQAATGFFSSPSDLFDAGQQTNTAFHEMFDAVMKNRSSAHPTISKAIRDEFVPFSQGWDKFYQENLQSVGLVFARWATSALQSHLVAYQQQMNAWAARLKKYGIKGAVFDPTTSKGKNIFMWIGIGVVTLGAIYVIAKTVRKATLGGAALEEAEDEAMRLVEEKKRKRHDRTLFSIA
jgi:hypothetical protein